MAITPIRQHGCAVGDTAGLAWTLETDGPHTILSLRGDLDLASANAAIGLVEGLPDADSRTLIVDLRNLRFLDVAGATALLRCNEVARARYFTVAFIAPCSQVATALRLTGFDRVLSVVGS